MELLCYCAERKFTAPDSLRECLDNTLPVQRIAAQIAQTAKVPSHRLRRGRVAILFQRFSGCADGGLEQLRRQLSPLKNRDKALVRRTFSLTVAAPRRLHDGIQPRQFPVDGRKIHIHTRLDQRCGYHPAWFPPS